MKHEAQPALYLPRLLDHFFMRTQQEESAYRRYHPVQFPTLLAACETCREEVWSDQGHVYVKGLRWTEKSMFLDCHHDDCYTGTIPPEREVQRKAKLKLEPTSEEEIPEAKMGDV